MHYLLFYEVGEDFVVRRAEFREAHLGKAWNSSQRGELVMGGALANPADGAVLLFRGGSPEVAERFAREDPYVTGGLVKHWRVREWTTVAGEQAATPVRPKAAAGTAPDGSSKAAAEDGGSAGRVPILRIWRAHATADRAGDYIQHATRKVFPALRAIKGHRGAFLLRRVVDGAIEFVVLTLWDSMDAIRRFAGPQPDQAVVEPEARAVLASFDESVTHFELVYDRELTPN